MTTNIVTAAFGGSKVVRTRALYQWDYGQILQFSGIDLPDAYTVHFSNQGVGGEAKTMVGNADGVTIPDEYLTTGQTVYAWVYLHAGDADGETVYSVIIPVVARPKPVEDEPTPAQQGAVDQAIAALNDGVDRAEAAAEAAEQAVEGVQDTVDAALEAAKESGEFDGADGVSPTATVTQTATGATITVTDAQGTTTAEITNGQDGSPGTPGAPGTDGISPTITVTDITGGHRVTITDADGPHSFDVMDGGDAVQDVQVNGVSVLNDGVANVPMATPTIPGVVKSGTVSVTGSTPSITALPGIRYVCGEVATLGITLPASGIVDVVFTSGSTPTVLTVTGVTWPEWFDPTSLEANRTYELSIADGFGAVMSWA